MLRIGRGGWIGVREMKVGCVGWGGGGGGGGGVTPQEFPNAVLCLLPNHVPAAMHARR